MKQARRGDADGSDLEVFTWIHPRRSSDSFLVAEGPEDGTPAVWYGVADMIGRPKRRGWQTYMRTVERQLCRRLREEAPTQAAAHHALLRNVLMEHNRHLYTIRTRHDVSAFGFCVCFISLFGLSCHVYGLGDCRAYRLRRIVRPGSRSPAFEVKVLTRDQNALDRFLREREEERTVFFRNELMDLSKRLNTFLGIGDDGHVASVLEAQNMDIEWDAGDCLLLVTDGFSMPLIRDILAVSQGLSLDDFYLESWLSRLLEREAEGSDPMAVPDWPAWVGGLTREVRHAADRRPKYRDDIALLGLYRP